jgi:hypothetical protein
LGRRASFYAIPVEYVIAVNGINMVDWTSRSYHSLGRQYRKSGQLLYNLMCLWHKPRRTRPEHRKQMSFREETAQDGCSGAVSVKTSRVHRYHGVTYGRVGGLSCQRVSICDSLGIWRHALYCITSWMCPHYIALTSTVSKLIDGLL